jgi:transcriptional regulator with XRE-family HTH domain
MDILAVIAANLSRWMLDNPNLNTLKKVSARSGVGFGTVRRCKNAEGNPTIANLVDIARAFGKSLDDLLRLPDGTTRLMTSEVAPAVTYLAPRPERLLVREIADLAERINDDGLKKATGYLECLAGSHPLAKAKVVSST